MRATFFFFFFIASLRSPHSSFRSSARARPLVRTAANRLPECLCSFFRVRINHKHLFSYICPPPAGAHIVVDLFCSRKNRVFRFILSRSTVLTFPTVLLRRRRGRFTFCSSVVALFLPGAVKVSFFCRSH